ncbi:MAG: hypothetical protein JXR19_09740 [Bacteroidia bacterium]
MLYQLRNLNEEEKSVIINAPIWVTLLIACVDENINPNEIDKAKEVINVRSFTEDSDVRNLYKELNHDFEHAVQLAINALPLVGSERIAHLISNLEKMNPILAKLEHTYAVQLHEGLTRLAAVVANSDGGFFGIGAVSRKEAQYIGLPMINKP